MRGDSIPGGGENHDPRAKSTEKGLLGRDDHVSRLLETSSGRVPPSLSLFFFLSLLLQFRFLAVHYDLPTCSELVSLFLQSFFRRVVLPRRKQFPFEAHLESCHSVGVVACKTNVSEPFGWNFSNFLSRFCTFFCSGVSSLFSFLVFRVHNRVHDDEKLSIIEIDATLVKKKDVTNSLGFVSEPAKALLTVRGVCFNDVFVLFKDDFMSLTGWESFENTLLSKIRNIARNSNWKIFFVTECTTISKIVIFSLRLILVTRRTRHFHPPFCVTWNFEVRWRNTGISYPNV